MSIERAFSQSDVVVEVALKPEIPVDELWIAEEEDLETGSKTEYVLTGYTFDVSKVWKGKKTETVRIYVDPWMTISYRFDPGQKYVVFARFFDPQNGVRYSGLFGGNAESRVSQSHEDPRKDFRLFTNGCSGNTSNKESGAHDFAKLKLDRIQEEGIGHASTREHAVALRELIREIVKSNKDTPSVSE